MANFGFGTAAPGTYSLDDLDFYRKQWDETFESFTGLYRQGLALLLNPAGLARVRSERLSMPVLLLHGSSDAYILPHVSELSMAYCDHESSTREIVEGASHWMVAERPDFVNARLLQFIED